MCFGSMIHGPKSWTAVPPSPVRVERRCRHERTAPQGGGSGLLRRVPQPHAVPLPVVPLGGLSRLRLPRAPLLRGEAERAADERRARHDRTGAGTMSDLTIDDLTVLCEA